MKTSTANAMEQLFERNKKIKGEADEILYENGLLEVLERYGKPHVSGSYALDLMTWRDLDIYLRADALSERQFFELGATLCTALSPLRMHFRNEHLAKTEGLPQGLYWGVYLGDEREGAWKIDVWAVAPPECERLIHYCSEIKKELDERTSATILSIKSQCWQDPEFRKLYSSSDIYDAVLHAGVQDLDGFWHYLDN